MHGAQFCADLTMVIASSASKRLRRPARKIEWSSERRTRICCLVLAMSTERNLDGQTRSMAWVGLHVQHAPHSTRTLLDGNRPQAKAIQFFPGDLTCEAKTFAIVVTPHSEPTPALPPFYHAIP